MALVHHHHHCPLLPTSLPDTRIVTTQPNLRRVTSLNMPAPRVTRAALKSVNKNSRRRWLPAQMAAGLHHMIHHQSSDRAAADYVNRHSIHLLPHVLTRSSLLRMYGTLPDSLTAVDTASEALLLQHIHTVQAERQEKRVEGHAMLTCVEEELLVQWVVREYNMNLPATQTELIAKAQRLFMERTGTVWPGLLRNWYYAFMRRHSALTRRLSENMSKCRLMAEERQGNIADWFTKLLPYKHFPPYQIYAADETGLSGDGSRTEQVIAPIGARRVYRKSVGYHEHTSLLHIGNAVGTSLPPIWIFKGTKLDVNLAEQMEQFSPLSTVGVQENGYFTAGHSLSVLEHFVKHAVKARPLLLIMDGASGHLDNTSIDYACNNDIHFLVLPSHCTHLLQVADVAVFAAFKTYWRRECSKRRAEKRMNCARDDVGIKRSDIIPLAVAAWNRACKVENVQSGFRRTGIYPYCPDEYKKTAASHSKLTSLTGCPSLLLSPALPTAIQAQSPALASLINSPSLAEPDVPPPAAGAAPKKKSKRTLNLSCGALLTSQEVRQQIAQRDGDKEAEVQALKRRKLERAEKRAEKAKEQAAKAVRKAVLMAEKVAAAAAKPPEAKKQRKRKTEAVQAAAEDKENVDPNASLAAPVADNKARYACSVLRRASGDVLRLRACV
jgi:hypothetical protein